MGAPLYRCPVCLHSSFSSVTALWQGLMSGASRRLSCPVCQEVLLGLDKLTLHLYSHLPVATSTTNSTLQPQEDQKKHPEPTTTQSIMTEQQDQCPSSDGQHVYGYGSSQFSVSPTKQKSSCEVKTTSSSSAAQWESANLRLLPASFSKENNDNCKLNSGQQQVPCISVHYDAEKPDSFNSTSVKLQDSAFAPTNTVARPVSKPIAENAPVFHLSMNELNVDTPLQQTDQQLFATPHITACTKETTEGDSNTSSSGLNMLAKQQNKYVCYNPDLQCSDCGAVFTTQRMLNTHVQIVHDPMSRNATQHQDQPVHPFPCHLCNRRFKMRGSLMVHVRFVHGGLRLAKAAKNLCVTSSNELDSTMQQQMRNSATPPSNNSPEPLFPSLSELSEQLSASPSQSTLNPNSTTVNTPQVTVVLNPNKQCSLPLQGSDSGKVDTPLQHSSIAVAKTADTRAGYSQWQDHDTEMLDTSSGREATSTDLVHDNQWVLAPSINDTSFCTQSQDAPEEWDTQDMQDALQKCAQQDINLLQSGPIAEQNMESTPSKFGNNEELIPNDTSVQDNKEPKPVCGSATAGKVGATNDVNKAYECEVCFKRFTTKYFHKKHQRLHTGERPYTCTTCGKTFAFQQSFHKHLLYHTSAKPHACSECGQAFKELSTLHNHQRIHTGERPFVCETCGKAFRQRVSYLVHRRIHTGVLPYKCSACNKSFRYKVSQRTHKCQAQPPGNVIRQSELVQRLLLKAASAMPEVTVSGPQLYGGAATRETTINLDTKVSAPNSSVMLKEHQEQSRTNFPPLLTINEESLHQLLSIFPN